MTPQSDPLSARKVASDINTKHALAVQRFSRPPYDLKTRVIVVSHHEGFLATVEWRWKDPNRDGRTIVAVTSGINGNKKLAMSEAYRAMLTKQKLLDNSQTAQKEAVIHIEEFMNDGQYAQACKAMLEAVSHADLPLKSVVHSFPSVWRSVVALHDHRLVELLVCVLEKSEAVPVSLYESLLQELVYLSDFSFAESTLLTLSSDRVKVAIPDRGLLASGDDSAPPEVEKWKSWRSLLALEELSNTHAALSNRDQLQSMRLSLDSTSLPIVKLRGYIREPVLIDSVALIASPGDHHMHLTGRVVECSTRPDGETVVTVSLLSEEENNLLWVLDELDLTVLAESRVTFDRISNCLKEFFNVSHVPDMTYRFSKSVRRILLDPTMAAKSKLSLPNPPSLAKQTRYLNLSEVQIAAVVHALTHPVTLVHGPAGTGKTHTLCGIVSAWSDSSDSKILCCADSNTATDNIYDALRRKGIMAYRLGTWKALGDVSESVLSSLPNKVLVDKYRSIVAASQSDPAKHRSYLIGLRRQIEEEAVRHFKVVVTTLSSSRNSVLDKIIFPNVIVDESAQTIEPACLLALSHGAERVVLIGDHKQLPAVVLSTEAIRRGMSVSLFERLLKAEVVTAVRPKFIRTETQDSLVTEIMAVAANPSVPAVPSVLLNVQRRMHPSIAEWPNSVFYDNKLENHISVPTDDDVVLDRFGWLSGSSRVVFIDTEGGSEELVGTSTKNASESSLLVEIVDRLLKSNVKPNQLGVIVPYLAQKQAVVSELDSRRIGANMHVGTVEGFQGHERDYIVISTTRSNVHGALGFLEDDQRMNVMLTRARKGVIVVGDRHTLKKRTNGRWAEWLAWCEKNACIVTAREIRKRH